MNSVCIDLINSSEEIIANCRYKNISNYIEILEILNNLIVGYNNSNLPQVTDPDGLFGIRFFENDGRDIRGVSRIHGVLMDNSVEDAITDYPDEDFLEDSFSEGEIGYNGFDIDRNEYRADLIVYVHIAEKRISILNYKLNLKREYKKKYLAEVSGVNESDLDVFSFDITDFRFYEIEEILDFIETHNVSQDDDTKYFLLFGDEDFVYCFENKKGSAL